MKKKILFMTFAAILSFSSAVFAQNNNSQQHNRQGAQREQTHHGNHHQMQHHNSGDCCSKELGFTEAQQKQLKDIKLKQEKQLLPIENQIKEKKARLQTLRTADKVDMNEINKTVEEIGKLKTEKMKIEEASYQEIRKILTEEQRLKFDSKKHDGCKGKHKQGHK